MSEWLVRKRVAISGLTFFVLLGGAAILGVRPREFTVGHFEPLYLASLCLIFGGLLMRTWAAGTLTKNQRLTTTGPYRLVRNPLYVGSFCMIVGFCLYTSRPLELLLLVSPLIVVYALAVRKEERRMAKYFGQDWFHYAAQVPRFLPCCAIADFADWSWAQWRKNREYFAVLTTITAFVFVEIWEVVAF